MQVDAGTRGNVACYTLSPSTTQHFTMSILTVRVRALLQESCPSNHPHGVCDSSYMNVQSPFSDHCSCSAACRCQGGLRRRGCGHSSCARLVAGILPAASSSLAPCARLGTPCPWGHGISEPTALCASAGMAGCDQLRALSVACSTSRSGELLMDLTSVLCLFK